MIEPSQARKLQFLLAFPLLALMAVVLLSAGHASANPGSSTSESSKTTYSAEAARGPTITTGVNGLHSRFGSCFKRKRGGVACFPLRGVLPAAGSDAEFVIPNSGRIHVYTGKGVDPLYLPNDKGTPTMQTGDVVRLGYITCALAGAELSCFNRRGKSDLWMKRNSYRIYWKQKLVS